MRGRKCFFWYSHTYVELSALPSQCTSKFSARERERVDLCVHVPDMLALLHLAPEGLTVMSPTVRTSKMQPSRIRMDLEGTLAGRTRPACAAGARYHRFAFNSEDKNWIVRVSPTQSGGLSLSIDAGQKAAVVGRKPRVVRLVGLGGNVADKPDRPCALLGVLHRGDGERVVDVLAHVAELLHQLGVLEPGPPGCTYSRT